MERVCPRFRYAHSATQCNQNTKSLDQDVDIDWAPLYKRLPVGAVGYEFIQVDSKMIGGRTIPRVMGRAGALLVLSLVAGTHRSTQKLPILIIFKLFRNAGG